MLQKATNAKENSTNGEIEEEIRLAWNKVYMDSYLDSSTDKVEALETELKGSEVKRNGDFLDIKYKGKDISINATTGEIKQPLPVIKAGEKAPATSNAQYKSGNYTAIIPAGFMVSDVKIVNETTGEVEKDETTIETGLVIRDDAENEFVWIPVGIPWRSASNKRITLARYEFKDANDSTSGTIVQVKTDGGAISVTDPWNNSFEVTEEAPREIGTNNAVAKNINDFISKTNAAGGFWIGRYEARTTSQTSRSSSSDPLTAVTEKPGNAVYNYIKQTDASVKAREMYSENKYFESDLINSYAWDTATLFLQEYDNREGTNFKPYSIQKSYNVDYPLAIGTIAETNKDKICNVYDMASNCYEWTTETAVGSNGPCVKRGGDYGGYFNYTSGRLR